MSNEKEKINDLTTALEMLAKLMLIKEKYSCEGKCDEVSEETQKTWKNLGDQFKECQKWAFGKKADKEEKMDENDLKQAWKDTHPSQPELLVESEQTVVFQITKAWCESKK